MHTQCAAVDASCCVAFVALAELPVTTATISLGMSSVIQSKIVPTAGMTTNALAWLETTSLLAGNVWCSPS